MLDLLILFVTVVKIVVEVAVFVGLIVGTVGVAIFGFVKEPHDRLAPSTFARERRFFDQDAP